MNSGEVVELFDGGWLETGGGLASRARDCGPTSRSPPGKNIPVGKRVGEWVYELFITTLPIDGFLVEDVLDLYQGGGPLRECSLMKRRRSGSLVFLHGVRARTVANCVSVGVEPATSAGTRRCKETIREIEWAPPKARSSFVVQRKTQPEEYGPWQWAAAFGRATGRFGAEGFACKRTGTLRCPAGANLWLSEVRQENAFTQRAVYLAYQTDCPQLFTAGAVLGVRAKGDRARRVSAVRRLLPALRLWSETPICSERSDGWMWQVEHFAAPGWLTGAGNMLRCFRLLRSHQEAEPPPRPPRAVRSHHRWSWHDRLARNAWWGPPQLRITVAGVPTFLASK